MLLASSSVTGDDKSMPMMSLLRSAVPPNYRARLRRSKMINRMLSWRYGGERHKRHPHAPFDFYFDGMKNLGWTIGSLETFEATDLRFALGVLAERQCKCVWDVGANLGFWSLAFCGLPGVQEVVAFEPDPANLRLLKKSRDVNNIDRLTVREVGLSNRTGTAEFFSDPLTGTTGSLEQSMDFIGEYYGATRVNISVTLSTIDAEVAGGRTPPEFLKIDVEGHELDVLQGGVQTLTKFRPPMILEVTSKQSQVTQLLRSLGYRLIRPSTGEEMAETEFSTAAMPI